MPNINTKLNFHFFHLPLVILGIMFVGALTYNTLSTNENPTVLGTKSKNTNVSSSKPPKVTKIKDAVTPSGNTHKNTISEVVTTLDEVAQKEELYGHTDVSDEVADVSDNTEETAVDTVEAIDAVESRPEWKTALLGPDYKNLGQLRSSLAKNTNEIRKLTKAMDGATLQNKEQIQTQLEALNQERQRIYELVNTAESKFSLLGWISRLLAGYTPIADDETEEGSTVPSTDLEGDTTEPSTITLPGLTEPSTTPIVDSPTVGGTPSDL